MTESLSGTGTSYSHITTSGARQGDRFRIRAVLVNVSDSHLAVQVRPCGLELVTELELAERTGAGTCEAVERMLAPGDSLWAEQSGVVTSSPGGYPVELNFASDQPGTTAMSRFGVHVSPAGVAVPGMEFSPSRKLPYVVTFLTASPETPIDVHDVDGAVREGLSQRGFMAIPYSRDAAEAIRGSTPYLSVFAAIEPDGGHRVRLCWIGLYEREMCKEYSAGGFTRPVGFGSRLALEARERLEEYRRRLPSEAAAPPEPGGR